MEAQLSKVLLSVPEAAAETGLPERTIRLGISRGEIPGRRIGRYVRVPLWWIEEQRNGPRSEQAA